MPRHTWPARWEMIKIKKMAKSGDQISLHFLYLLMPKILTPIPGFGITKRSLSALGIFCCQSLIVSLGTLFFLIFLSLSVMMPCTHVWCQSQSISCFFFLIFLSLGVMMRNTHGVSLGVSLGILFFLISLRLGVMMPCTHVWCQFLSISWYFFSWYLSV